MTSVNIPCIIRTTWLKRYTDPEYYDSIINHLNDLGYYINPFHTEHRYECIIAYVEYDDGIKFRKRKPYKASKKNIITYAGYLSIHDGEIKALRNKLPGIDIESIMLKDFGYENVEAAAGKLKCDFSAISEHNYKMIAKLCFNNNLDKFNECYKSAYESIKKREEELYEQGEPGSEMCSEDYDALSCWKRRLEICCGKKVEYDIP